MVLAFPLSTQPSRLPLLVWFWHSRFQRNLPASHCYCGSGIPAFNATFPHRTVSMVLAFPLPGFNATFPDPIVSVVLAFPDSMQPFRIPLLVLFLLFPVSTQPSRIQLLVLFCGWFCLLPSLTRTHIKHMLLNLHFIWKPTGQSVSSYMCKLGSNQNVYEKLQKHICLVYLP